MTGGRPAGPPMGEQLARCAGFVVRAADGGRVGKVAWVRYATRADCPDALVVRGGGRFGGRGRTADIPCERVETVDRAARTVTLSEPPGTDLLE